MAQARKCPVKWPVVAALAAAELALYYVIFYTIPGVAPTGGTKLLLFVISLLSPVLCAVYLLGEGELASKYNKRGYKLAIVFCAFYASLASFAQRFFFEGYSRMHLSLSGLLCCALAFLWFIFVLGGIIVVLEKLSSLKSSDETKCGRGFYIGVFLLYCVWQGIVFMAFRPGGFPPDSVSQLFQAIGYERIYDWHPALHTLYFRLILRLTGNRVMMINAVEMVAFAALTAAFVCLFIKWGCRKWFAVTGGLVFLMLPNNVLSEVAAVKDFPYSLSLMWATLLLCRLAGDLKSQCRFSTLAQLSVATFFVFGFRHNGIVPAVFIIILCLVLTVKKFSLVRFRLALTALAAVLMMIVYKGPVFALFNVSPNTASPYTTMLCAVGSVVNQGLPLSDETNEILESVISLEEWGEYYNKYEGHDEYTWGRGEDATFVTEHIDAKMAFSMYLEALFRYPDVVIKDRLDGMDLLWDIKQPTDSFNAKSFDTIYLMPFSDVFFNIDHMEEKGYYQYARPSRLADWYREWANTDTNTASDMLLWRTGSYLILMLVVLIYICANDKKRLLWAAVPLGGNVFGLLFLLYHQSFRYVYAVQLMVVALCFAALFFSETKEETCA